MTNEAEMNAVGQNDKGEEEDVVIVEDESEEEQVTKASSKGKKRAVAVVVDSEEEAEAEGSSKKAKIESAVSASSSSSSKKVTSPTKSTTGSNSFFAPRVSPVKPEKIAAKPVGSHSSPVKATKKKVEPKVVKGKGKGKKVIVDEEDDEEEEHEAGSSKSVKEDEEEDDDASDDDGADAAQLADIFTRKSTTSASNRVTWANGAPVPYAALTATFHAISATTKRLEISAHLTRFLIEVIEKTPADLLNVVYLCINRLAPDYEAVELGIGESTLVSAIAACTGRPEAQIKSDYQKIGDLGEVALMSKKSQPTLSFFKAPSSSSVDKNDTRLSVNKVFTNLTKIAKTKGKDMKKQKLAIIRQLFVACQGGSDSKFIVRALEGKLRIGLAEKTALVSLSHAIVQTEMNASGKKVSKEKMSEKLENGAEILKAVFSELPSYNLVIPALLEKGIDHVKEICFLTPGIPLKPMLAKPTKAIDEVLKRFEGKKFTCEYKYDGERAQVHFLEDGSIKVFSRNSLNMTEKYPEFVTQLPHCIKEGTTSFIIDAEAVAWCKETKRLLPFQILSGRKRKDVKEEDIKVKVHLFAFDLLYLNGQSLLHLDLENRRELLRKHLQPVDGEFAFATSNDATNVEDIQGFLDQSIVDRCEGLMVKLLQGEGASYEPSRRSVNWLKLKKDYLAGLADTFDLVIIGANIGSGSRTGFYGSYHLACYDVESSTYQAVCKFGTGLKVKEGDGGSVSLQTLYNLLEPHKLAQKKAYYDVSSKESADVYFEPVVVVEVKAADLTVSPEYPAAKGLVHETNGISLRFPVFLRIRSDKGPEQSTTPEQIAEAYIRQAGISGKGGRGNDGDDYGLR